MKQKHRKIHFTRNSNLYTVNKKMPMQFFKTFFKYIFLKPNYNSSDSLCMELNLHFQNVHFIIRQKSCTLNGCCRVEWRGKERRSKRMLRQVFPHLPLSLVGNYNGNNPVTLTPVIFTYTSFHYIACFLFFSS